MDPAGSAAFSHLGSLMRAKDGSDGDHHAHSPYSKLNCVDAAGWAKPCL